MSMYPHALITCLHVGCITYKFSDSQQPDSVNFDVAHTKGPAHGKQQVQLMNGCRNRREAQPKNRLMEAVPPSDMPDCCFRGNATECVNRADRTFTTFRP